MKVSVVGGAIQCFWLAESSNTPYAETNSIHGPSYHPDGAPLDARQQGPLLRSCTFVHPTCRVALGIEHWMHCARDFIHCLFSFGAPIPASARGQAY
jgi:hypothetical protein